MTSVSLLIKAARDGDDFELSDRLDFHRLGPTLDTEAIRKTVDGWLAVCLGPRKPVAPFLLFSARRSGQRDEEALAGNWRQCNLKKAATAAGKNLHRAAHHPAAVDQPGFLAP